MVHDSCKSSKIEKLAVLHNPCILVEKRYPFTRMYVIALFYVPAKSWSVLLLCVSILHIAKSWSIISYIHVQTVLGLQFCWVGTESWGEKANCYLNGVNKATKAFICLIFRNVKSLRMSFSLT